MAFLNQAQRIAQKGRRSRAIRSVVPFLKRPMLWSLTPALCDYNKVIPITVASVAEWQLEHGSLCFFEIGAVFLQISIKFSQHIVEFRMVLIEFPTSAQHRRRGGGAWHDSVIFCQSICRIILAPLSPRQPSDRLHRAFRPRASPLRRGSS